MAVQRAGLAAVLLVAGMACLAAGEGAVRIVSPYEQVDWDKVEFVHSFSHQHGTDPQVFWDMGFRHFPLSNYYPSRPIYPLPAAFVRQHPEAIAAPNAEQHSMTDSGYHFCVLGSFYTVGYGQTPKFKPDTAPVEYTFKGLNVFDAKHCPWQGVYRLDVRVGMKAGKQASIALTVDGGSLVSHKTFDPIGDGVVRQKRLTDKSPESMYFKTTSDSLRVRLEFDPATTRIDRFRLMQGTNRPWRDAFRAALDGTGKDEAGRPIEGLLFPDAGGITINHPGGSVKQIVETLDFDPRVLGIEVWNQHRGFGGMKSDFYQLWDGALREGRRCYGFFVKDHVWNGSGRNVLLLSQAAMTGPKDREHEALRAYREGRFFGLLGALAVDASGNPAPPYDQTAFRFTRITVRNRPSGEPAGVEVAVDGADRGKRPNTLIRFVTESGIARVVSGPQAFFEFPRDPAGQIACRYVRVEAFAYPDTHDGGKRLTAESLGTMSVHEVFRIHDRLGSIPTSKIDPPGKSPIPIVDMLFSQPILVQR